MPSGIYSDRSDKIVLGGTCNARPAIPANPARLSAFIHNPSAVDTLFIELGQKAVQGVPSIAIPPLQSWSMEEPGVVDPRDIYIIGPTTGGAFIAREA
jgi:hypothetical protein